MKAKKLRNEILELSRELEFMENKLKGEEEWQLEN
jgi:hypothetical protein